jgi:thioredoxin 1
MKQLWYFFSEWCQPCKTLSPIMDSLQRQGIPINKLNTDYTPDVVTKYNVRSVPTVILVENGAEVRRFVGVKSVNEILNFYNG